MLRSAKADSLRAELHRHYRIARRIGIGSDAEPSDLVGPAHELFILPIEQRFLRIEGSVQNLQNLRGLDGYRPAVDLAGEAVDRDVFACFQLSARCRNRSGLVVYREFAGTGDAGQAHSAGDDRRVRGHSAARGEDAFRDGHSADVLRRRLDAAEDDATVLLDECLAFVLREFFGIGFDLGCDLLGLVGVEDQNAGRAAGRGGQAVRDDLAVVFGLLLIIRIEDRREELVQLVCGDAHQGLFFVD